MNCEFCNKQFSNLGNLNYHKKTAKYCLNLRDEKFKKSQGNKCEYCNNEFTRKSNLINHYLSCKEKLIFVYKKEIDILKDCNLKTSEEKTN